MKIGNSRINRALAGALILLLICPSVVSGIVETTVPLIAGQHIPVGNVMIGNTEDELVITYSTDPGWLLTETHVDVAIDYSGLNTTKKGNPKPGKFRFSIDQSTPVDQVTYRIPLTEWPGAESLVIATHAVVISDSGNETAWAGNIDFPGANWATYFMYTIQEMEPPPENGILSFGQSQFDAEEQPRGQFVVTVPVIRELGNSGKISVKFRTVDGTATAGIDYVATFGTLEFDDQVLEQSFSVTVLDDRDIDPNETIILELFDSCCLGEPATAVIIITDDESSN